MNFAIVDVKPRQGGHDVFDHFHPGAVALQAGASRNLDAVIDMGRNVRAMGKIASHEHHARVYFRRSKFHVDVPAAPISEAGNDGRPCDRTLFAKSVHQTMPIIPDGFEGLLVPMDAIRRRATRRDGGRPIRSTCRFPCRRRTYPNRSPERESPVVPISGNSGSANVDNRRRVRCRWWPFAPGRSTAARSRA